MLAAIKLSSAIAVVGDSGNTRRHEVQSVGRMQE
jgi:hypothetical protein